MTSPGKSKNIPDNRVGSNKRPTRLCKTKAIYDESDCSDEEPVKRKRLKLASDSDESFCVDLESKNKPKLQTKKVRTQKKEIKKSVVPKTKSRKVKKDEIKIEQNSIPPIKTELDEPAIPLKKIKIEPISCNDSFDNRQPSTFSKNPVTNLIKKEAEDCSITLKPECQLTNESDNSHIFQRTQPTKTEADYSNWKCELCNGVNQCWRAVCIVCNRSKIVRSEKNDVGDDWICHSYNCRARNYSWRKFCYRCKREKPSDNRFDSESSVKPSYNYSENSSELETHSKFSTSQTHDRLKSDWICNNPKCGLSNFSWRNQCFRCFAEKPQQDTEPYASHSGTVDSHASGSHSDSKFVKQEGDWICSNSNCRGNNFSWRTKCFQCSAVKPTVEQNYLSDTKFQPNVACSSLDEKPIKSELAKNVSKDDVDVSAKKKPTKAVKKEGTKTVVKKGRSVKNVTVKGQNDPDEVVGSDLQNEEDIYKEGNQDKKSNIIGNKLTENELTRHYNIISKRSNIPIPIVRNVIKLFDSEATIPFIVRYRSHLTGGLSASEIRLLKQNHESVKKLFDKGEKMKVKLESLGYLDPTLSYAIDACETQQELDYLYEPFKVLKTSKLVKVIDMGLSTPAENLLNGNGVVHFEQFVQEGSDLNEVIDLIIYYVGEMMSKDSNVMDRVRELMKSEKIFLKAVKKTPTTSKKVVKKEPKKTRHEDVYSNYYNFSCPCIWVKPHQILAINRGEAENCLKVSLDIPNSFNYKICQFARNKWFFKGPKYEQREIIFTKALDFLYNKRVSPYVKRQIRTELTKQGEKASLEVFAANLKHLLLTQPVRNVTVCSVDPGFTHGCKIAILNPHQEILDTSVLYLDNYEHFSSRYCKFVRLINDHKVDLLVVGNGKGCRDVELKISELIEKNFLDRSLKYVVASENGISVYSCSQEALEEYPNISPNIISAISLAKRIQDPLCELVKVEPKHLGVGMYQHDINEKKLDSVIDDVVSECVSIVGVNVNNAPLRILKRVAGLSESRAKTIIETRVNKGLFVNREELKKIKGIGPKTFQQCAGFIKVIPLTKTDKEKSGINYFDQTIIHPEDYASAKKILDMNELTPSQIGTLNCIEKLKLFSVSENLNALACKLNIPFETLKLILEALTSPIDYDIRSTFDKPLFRNKATTIHDLSLNSEVCGRVENVTHFGAFVDLGIECNGLIYTSNLNGRDLHLGQIVRVKIIKIDTHQMRIGLSLVSQT